MSNGAENFFTHIRLLLKFWQLVFDSKSFWKSKEGGKLKTYAQNSGENAMGYLCKIIALHKQLLRRNVEPNYAIFCAKQKLFLSFIKLVMWSLPEVSGEIFVRLINV